MKNPLLVMVLCVSGTFIANAQSVSNKAYAITSKTFGAHEWTEVKEISLVNGEVTRNVFENNNIYNLFDGRSGKAVTVNKGVDFTKENSFHPFSGLSAACAYDSKTNRLYYTPMFANELRYIDLNAGIPHIYLFRNEKFSSVDEPEAEANQITRMVVASDGNGYALSNNGEHLVRFTTDKKPVISDLGSIYDAPENGDVSVHDANTSWGGDLLADASGNLYLITAHNYVFKIDLQTKIATYLTKIKGLPESFTTNGAVVNEEGNIVVSSANYLTSYYTVDPRAWQATSVEARQQVYNTSDLANDNLLFRTRFSKEENIQVKENISVFPNPVRSKMFRVSFDNQQSGKYNVQLVDVSGRLISDKPVSVSNGSQVSEIRVDQSVTRGMYFVKVLNNLNKEIYTKKLVVE